MLCLADRLKKVQPSPTLAISAQTTELKRQGKNIINMGVGEPDFQTPLAASEYAIQAIQQNQTKYTPVSGTVELKQAIIEKFKKYNHLTYTKQEVLASTGAKQAIYSLLQAVINTGDEVLIPAPYWVSYPDMVLLASGTPVFIETTWENSFKITPQKLEQMITDKTKVIIFNSPSNPSGMTYTKTEWQALAAVLKKHPNIIIISDEIYEYIYWGKEPFSNIINACPELKSQTVIINGVSKAFAMTGWRIGFSAGPEWIISGMTAIQGHSTSNPCSIAQAAAEAALMKAHDLIPNMVQTFKKRHDFVFEQLNNIAGVHILPSQGTFYAFPCINQILKNQALGSDLELAQKLLTAGIAVVPGSAFGSPGYLRLSYALHDSELTEALKRLTATLIL
ncbi:MAG: pyridoxal phosphate-dependent aminotransferase [Endozoicomonadaceae bacterium]|nr:pyridoxal phosphate-dependent aminotransferase [Endozoicomonadaceae bacterium]